MTLRVQEVPVTAEHPPERRQLAVEHSPLEVVIRSDVVWSSEAVLRFGAGQGLQCVRAVGAQPRRQRPQACTDATAIGCTKCDRTVGFGGDDFIEPSDFSRESESSSSC